jgi:hypothetical protein
MTETNTTKKNDLLAMAYGQRQEYPSGVPKTFPEMERHFEVNPTEDLTFSLDLDNEDDDNDDVADVGPVINLDNPVNLVPQSSVVNTDAADVLEKPVKKIWRATMVGKFLRGAGWPTQTESLFKAQKLHFMWASDWPSGEERTAIMVMGYLKANSKENIDYAEYDFKRVCKYIQRSLDLARGISPGEGRTRRACYSLEDYFAETPTELLTFFYNVCWHEEKE